MTHTVRLHTEDKSNDSHTKDSYRTPNMQRSRAPNGIDWMLREPTHQYRGGEEFEGKYALDHEWAPRH